MNVKMSSASATREQQDEKDNTYSLERNSYQVTFPVFLVSDVFLCFALWHKNLMILTQRKKSVLLAI